MAKKPVIPPRDDRELEPWEREAEELGATGDAESEVIGPAKPAEPPITPQTGPAVPKVNSSKDKSSITKVPGPKRKFQ